MSTRYAPRAGVSGGTNRAGAQTQAEAQRFLALLARFQAALNIESPWLEGGVPSRLALSLRSGIAEEQDFALERLLQATNFDADLVPVHHNSTLIEVLLDVIEAELQRRKEMLRLHPWAHSFRAEWQSPQTRRAIEAGLVLRNLALHEKDKEKAINTMELDFGRRLRRVILQTLKLGLAMEGGVYLPPSLSDGDHLDELRIYMLEILAVSTSYIRLRPPASVGVASGIEDELLPVLTALSYSPDRAVVILSLSILADFARADAHEALFSSAEATSATHSPLARALELLPLQDAEINAAALSYLYAVTNSVQVSIELTRQAHFVSLLRHLLLSITRSGQLELSEVEAPAFLQVPKKSRAPPPPVMAPSPARLTPDELQQILHLPEPQRLYHWLHLIFEEREGTEIAQIDLWKAYSNEFKPHEQTYKIMEPSDVIKHTPDACPRAIPKIVTDPEKRFIIAGLRPRVRRDLAHVFRCQWTGCPAPQAPTRTSAEALYGHFKEAHVTLAIQQGGRCSYSGCQYVVPPLQTAGGSEHANLAANAMALHLRTHIPTAPTNPEADAAISGKDFVPLDVIYAEVNDDGVAIGRGFLAAFALRNIARAIRTGMAEDSNDRIGGGAHDLISAIAGEDANADDVGVPVRMSPAAAQKAAATLATLGDDLLRLLTQCGELTAPLGEILDVVHLAHLAEASSAVKRANQMQIG